MELVLLSLAALAALGTLLRPARRLWGLAALLIFVGAAGAFTRPGPPRAGTDRDPETALRPVAVRGNGYVSSDTCRACHPGEYASWHKTFHRTMTQVVTPKTVISDWHGTELTLRGKTLRLEQVECDDPGEHHSQCKRDPRASARGGTHLGGELDHQTIAITKAIN